MTVKVDAPLGSRKRLDQVKRYREEVARKPPGSVWRFLAWGKRGREKVELSSEERPSIFDEVVISFGEDCIHIEQMDTRTWYVGLGKEKRMIHVKRDGSIEVGEMYR